MQNTKSFLARQLTSGGQLVPAAVRLDVQLYDPTTEFDMGGDSSPVRVRVPVAKFLELRADTANGLMAGHELEFKIADTRPLRLMVSTQIVVGGEHILNDYDSGLTVPWLEHQLDTTQAGEKFRVRLTTGGESRLEITKIEGDDLQE